MAKLVIKIKDHGSITIRLMEELAPMAVASVTDFARRKRYDGRAIERLEKDFVIQPLFTDGVDAEMDGLIEPEFLTNERNHGLPFLRGTVAMAGTEAMASCSQYFICLQKAERLQGHFTVIGEVTDGWEEIERLESLPLDGFTDEETGKVFHRPKDTQIVESVTVKEHTGC